MKAANGSRYPRVLSGLFMALVLPVASAGPLASAAIHYTSGAWWGACHGNSVQSPVRSIDFVANTIAVAQGVVDQHTETGQAGTYLSTRAAGSRSGPLTSSGGVDALYDMPVGLPCLDFDVRLDLDARTQVTDDRPFNFGRSDIRLQLGTARDPQDARPVHIEAGFLELRRIELSGGRGRADADVHISLIELRPGVAAELLFDVDLSAPAAAGGGVVASSSTHLALASEIAQAFRYEDRNDLHVLSGFGLSGLILPGFDLTDDYRHLVFRVETSLAAPEPMTAPLAVAALGLMFLLRVRCRARPGAPGPDH